MEWQGRASAPRWSAAMRNSRPHLISTTSFAESVELFRSHASAMNATCNSQALLLTENHTVKVTNKPRHASEMSALERCPTREASHQSETRPDSFPQVKLQDAHKAK